MNVEAPKASVGVAAPVVVRDPPRVSVLPVLATPVPPFAPSRMPVTAVPRGMLVKLEPLPLLGVPSAPPLMTGAPAEPTLTPSAVGPRCQGQQRIALLRRAIPHRGKG